MSKLRRPLAEILPEVSDQLTSLWVDGATKITKKDLTTLGFELYMDPYTLEDVVFDLLERRRDEVGQPYAIVTLADVKMVGREIKDGEYNADAIRKNQLFVAYTHLGELGVRNADLESATLTGHETLSRVVKAESRILSEPIGMEGFLGRISSQVEDDGEIRLLELVDRTINHVGHQNRRHGRIDTSKLRPGEKAVHYLEEQRLGRLRTLANGVLRNSLEVLFDTTNGG